MITQNPLGQIILPPVYSENKAMPVHPLFISGVAQSVQPPQPAPKIDYASVSPITVSATGVALVLVGLLTITTVLYYWNYLKRYKKTPLRNFVRAVKNDPKLQPRLRAPIR